MPPRSAKQTLAAQLPEHLPELLREMARDLGLAAMLHFASEFGGREIYVPKKATIAGAGRAITRRTSFEVLAWLVKRHGGGKLIVPLGPHSSYRARIIAARRMLDAGKSTDEIVTVLRMHERSVRRHRRALREAAEQPDLFRA